jgi:hypothetical protein
LPPREPCHASFATHIASDGKIEEVDLQRQSLETLEQVGRSILVGELELNGPKPGSRGRSEAIEEGDVGEEEAEVG